ncbi:hypothetical protein BC939DRAFT_479967 [Gamsiella multidivaricata]|uniref:uncharacterized protein n=1 Tax=Gamsiella multidivaricata TaxID=101098 RepID=UPI0022203FEF|nr:uncharacterized protein BC939DRAFT_479967 [Gamsiella multidivaricata]KAI7818909.1 hypothetical protein BC939DRAFT_479967 [Gamsiella multidivaricata]
MTRHQGDPNERVHCPQRERCSPSNFFVLILAKTLTSAAFSIPIRSSRFSSVVSPRREDRGGWCKGTCGITGEYQEKHVCKWGYWDERDIAAAVVATGWDSELWLDWVDIPAQAGWKKVNKIKAQAELYAGASRVFVFVPEHDFLSIKGALDLSETADTFDEFLEVIHLLGGVKWFTSTWTLQEMFMSYERMMVVTHGGKSIECGWLVTLQAQLGALLDSCGGEMHDMGLFGSISLRLAPHRGRVVMVWGYWYGYVV